MMNLSEDFQCGRTGLGVCVLNDTDGVTNDNQSLRMHIPAATFDSLISIGTALLLAGVILVTAVGNVFVISVILLERHLQSVANYLILSLAVADLLVACLVMPLGAVYQVSQKWLLGPALCDMWTSSDVLCCAASILHLVAIAIDRYWAVTSVDYIQRRTIKRIMTMIVIVWIISLFVSLGPVFGWKDDQWHHRIEVQHECLISQDVGYQVFATLATFYLPLIIILFLYWRIFQTAQKRIRRKQASNMRTASLMERRMSTSAPPISIVSGTTVLSVATRTDQQVVPVVRLVVGEVSLSENVSSGSNLFRRSATIKRRKVETKRERKAAKTLAIITGAFLVCWLPFFVVALLQAVCSTCHFNDTMVSFFLWLGYFNSTLNPILYTIFSPEFRVAFQKLLRLKSANDKRLEMIDMERRSIAVSNNSCQ